MDFNKLFETVKTIAVVGMSKDITKAAHTVPGYMKKQGYNVIPVNPSAEIINKMKVYPDIASIPDDIDMVNVFRPSEECGEIAKQVVERFKNRGDIKYLWLQLGITNDEAKQLAAVNGIGYVEDTCIYVSHLFWKKEKEMQE